MQYRLEAAGVRISDRDTSITPRNHPHVRNDPHERIQVTMSRSMTERLRVIARKRKTRLTTLIRSALNEKLIEWESC